MDAEEKEILREAKEFAQANDLKINPDKKIVEAVIKGIAKNKEKYGKKYCPCRAVTGNEELDKKSVCTCAFSAEEIKKTGHCKCRLFFSK